MKKIIGKQIILSKLIKEEKCILEVTRLNHNIKLRKCHNDQETTQRGIRGVNLLIAVTLIIISKIYSKTFN